jgi:hypothetical protein
MRDRARMKPTRVLRFVSASNRGKHSSLTECHTLRQGGIDTHRAYLFLSIFACAEADHTYRWGKSWTFENISPFGKKQT